MPGTFTDTERLYDKQNFIYDVWIEHYPDIGISYATKSDGTIIAEFQYGKYRLPQGDDDQEWEEFQQRFYDKIGDEAKENLIRICKEIYNNKSNKR